MVRWLGIALAAGCAGTDDDLSLDGDDDDDDEVDCVGADTFVAGITKTSTSGRTVAVSSALPTPPDVGDNSWAIEVTDTGGAPVEALSIEIVPWMPLHNHGLTPPTYGSIDAGGGTYDIDTFDLIMPGVWEFTVDVGVAEGAPDEAIFKFCAEG